LTSFEKAGSGKAAGSLEGLTTFNKKLVHEDTTNVAMTEDYFAPGQILEMNGSKVSEYVDFNKMMEAVQYLVQKNMEQHGWTTDEHPHQPDPQFPQFGKFWYVQSKGKTKTWQQTEHKTLGQDSKLKNVKMLEDAKQMMEALPYSEDASGNSTVAVVSVKHEELTDEVKETKTAQLILSKHAQWSIE